MAVESIKVPPQLAFVLNRAGDKSGVDFDYLLQTAIRESSLNPTARARTSSAVGLFQFLENTWLDVMKSDGPRLGYQKYADAIRTNGQGDFVVSDERLKAEILSLRENPAVAADLAAAFTRRNGEYLTGRFGRMPNAGELYIAHFLGAQGAARLFEAGLENPDQIAAELFPRQAAANEAIFYSDGKPRTIREVYKALVAKHIPEATPDVTLPAAFAAQQGKQPAAPVTLAPDAPLIPRAQPQVAFDSLFSNGGSGPATASANPAAAGFFAQLFSK